MIVALMVGAGACGFVSSDESETAATIEGFSDCLEFAGSTTATFQRQFPPGWTLNGAVAVRIEHRSRAFDDAPVFVIAGRITDAEGDSPFHEPALFLREGGVTPESTYPVSDHPFNDVAAEAWRLGYESLDEETRGRRRVTPYARDLPAGYADEVETIERTLQCFRAVDVEG